MKLQDLFRPEHVVVGLQARDKWDAIDRLVGHLVATDSLSEAQSRQALEAVNEREKSMSTGMERGLAIPHAAVDDLDAVVAALGIVGGNGLNFESIDGSPTRFVVLLLIPRAQKLLHIRTLATIARVLGDEDVREALLAAASATAAWNVLAESA